MGLREAGSHSISRHHVPLTSFRSSQDQGGGEAFRFPHTYASKIQRFNFKWNWAKNPNFRFMTYSVIIGSIPLIKWFSFENSKKGKALFDDFWFSDMRHGFFEVPDDIDKPCKKH